MTDEQICELAKDKALDIQKYIIDGNVDIDSFAKNCCLAGAHSRDEEVASLLSQLEDKDGYIAYLRKELSKLHNPWISVEDRLPEKGQACFLADFNKRSCGYGKFYTDDGMAARWECKEGYSAKIYLLHAVTHWMPIPQIEKGE